MMYGNEPSNARRARRTQPASDRRTASRRPPAGERYPCPAQTQAIAGFAAPQGAQGCGLGGNGAARAAAVLQTTLRAPEAASRLARSLSTHLGRALRGAGRDRRGTQAEGTIGCSRQAQVNA